VCVHGKLHFGLSCETTLQQDVESSEDIQVSQ
jgi:hypothetical protein